MLGSLMTSSAPPQVTRRRLRNEFHARRVYAAVASPIPRSCSSCHRRHVRWTAAASNEAGVGAPTTSKTVQQQQELRQRVQQLVGTTGSWYDVPAEELQQAMTEMLQAGDGLSVTSQGERAKPDGPRWNVRCLLIISTRPCRVGLLVVPVTMAGKYVKG